MHDGDLRWGAGDLTKRKLIPAIYYLAEQKLLPDNFALLGVARDQNTDEGYRALMREAMTHSDEIHKIPRRRLAVAVRADVLRRRRFLEGRRLREHREAAQGDRVALARGGAEQTVLSGDSAERVRDDSQAFLHHASCLADPHL